MNVSVYVAGGYMTNLATIIIDMIIIDHLWCILENASEYLSSIIERTRDSFSKKTLKKSSRNHSNVV